MKRGSSLARALFKGAWVVVLLMVGVLQAAAQNRTISGTVTDNMGEPLPGAYVIVPNTTNGVIANADGKFSISVPEGTVLRFSFTGLTPQEVTVGAQTEINVVLTEDATQLDNVVAVGYGTVKVKDLTGAATAVSMAQIPDFPAASLVDALAGQVVGLSVNQANGRPGNVGTFKIRQPVQFVGNSESRNAAFDQPLIVIDGVVQVDMYGNPTMDAFNMLDRSEIETMTVLKDASAAVYGSRASSGVILVETKRGTVGQAKISYNGRLDYADAVSHAKYMNAYELGKFTNQLIEQRYVVSNQQNDYRDELYSYSASELERMKGLNYDWLDEAWKPAISHRHSVTVDGGSQTATFFAGVSFQDQGNNLGNTQDYSKWGFRAGGTIQVAAGLKLSASVSANTDKQTKAKAQGYSNDGDYGRLRNMPKYIPWEWEGPDGEMHYVAPWMGPIGINNTITDANVSNGYSVQNFFANDASKARSENSDNGWSANFSLNYEIPFVKGLSVKASYAKSHTNKVSEEVGDYFQVMRATNTREAGKHLIGDYTEWTFLNFGDPNGTDISKKPKVNYTKTNSESEQINFSLNYSRTFGLHDIGATGVIERAEAFGSEMKQEYNGIGLSYNGSSTTAGTLNANGSSYRIHESGALSYIGRFHYKYADRYLFDFVIRSDASTKFAPENYWGTFPTASAGWIISEENFFKNSKLSDIFQFLKLRYSFGKTGKDNIDAWTWLTNYDINATDGWGFGEYGGQPYNSAKLAGTANRDITWDTSIKQNVGLDVTSLSNRLSITTDFYYDKTKDMVMGLFTEEDPIYIGAPVPKRNYGKMDAWGWEFSARWSDRIETGSSWGAIHYGIGVDYGISWTKTVLGNNMRFDYPSTLDSNTSATGWRSPGNEYGFKTWKHTSGGDGMLRTQEDIDKYWAYLTANAGEDFQPEYFGVTSPVDMKLGMIAYEDFAGSKDTDARTISGPDGRLTSGMDAAADYQKLASSRTHGINSRFNLSWGNFTWSAQLSTSWGGFKSIDKNWDQSISESAFINSSIIFLNDMFDPTTNPNGKWPSIMVGNYREDSDFWSVPTFRMYVRNMSFGYSVPKKLLSKINVDAVRLSLTGNNLWDFYNPYPQKYRNMYDSATAGYPTLRTWTFGLNVTF